MRHHTFSAWMPITLALAALALTGCAAPYRLISPPGPALQNTALSPTGSPDWLEDRFADSVRAAAKPDAGTDSFAKAQKEARGVVDYRCTQYFRSLGRASQDLGYTRQETSLTGGVAAGMLGLAGQSAKVIANTAAMFGFASASMDAYESSYLYSPDVGLVEQLVRENLKKIQIAQGTATLDSFGAL